MTEWRAVPGFPYSVSDDGRARNDRTGRVLKPIRTGRGKGHLYVVLCLDGRRNPRLLHRLIGEAFLPPSDLPVVRHLDDDIENNRASNLAWGTQGDNLDDSVRNGTHHWASRTHCSHGHEYTPMNTRLDAKGARVCKACARIRDARQRGRPVTVYQTPRAVTRGR